MKGRVVGGRRDRRWSSTGARFYEKELELRMSMSYGPGRYDRRYEELGLDYPIAYVRWTENRNLQAFLALAAAGAIDPRPPRRRRRCDFADAEGAYEELARGRAPRARGGLPLRPTRRAGARTLALARAPRAGAGERRRRASSAPATTPRRCCCRRSRGVPACSARCVVDRDRRRRRGARAEKFGFAALRHRSGARASPTRRSTSSSSPRATTATRALAGGGAARGQGGLAREAGRARRGAARVARARRRARPAASSRVGYNRRFSPHARAIREAFAARGGPLAIHYTVAAGPTPARHLARRSRAPAAAASSARPATSSTCAATWSARRRTSVFARALGRDPESDDSTVLVLGFADGSTATIEYLANASPELPKERFEVSADGRTACLRQLPRDAPARRPQAARTLNQDKGQAAAVSA